jgi:hypothetical protein
MEKVIFLLFLVKGKYIWNDGSFYQGDWVENKISGSGVYNWADGRKYEGMN